MMQTVLSFLGALGIGAIVGAYIHGWFERKNKAIADQHDLKRARYGAILIQMLTVLDPKVGLERVVRIRPDLKTLDDVTQELRTELLNAVLFASDDALRCLSAFNKASSQELYLKTAAAMRKDLWGKTTKITEKDLGALT